MTRLIGLLAAVLLLVGVGISFPGPATSARAPADTGVVGWDGVRGA